MKSEILILGITAFLIFNAYHDNKYTNKLKSFKKYYSMAFIGFTGLSLYLFSKKYPVHAYQGIYSARQLLSSIPVDKSAKHYFEPFLSTSEFDVSPLAWLKGNGTETPTSPPTSALSPLASTKPLSSSSTTTTKRSVSETKKKYVASQQNWKCGHCQSQLNAWFEVDHIQSLERGGSNHVANLVALCRECHGKKTALERMGI